MELTRFTPDDVAAIGAWVAVGDAINSVDAPWRHPLSPRSSAGWLEHGWDGEPSTPYLARVGETVVGAASIAASEYDNLHLAWVSVNVHPEHRRRGYGSAILAALLDEIRAMGRTSVGMSGWESEAGAAFAAAHGFERKLSNIERRQYLADVDWPALDAAYDAALPSASDYVLEHWPVPTPVELLDDLAEMASAINDAPMDDLDYEDEIVTGARMTAYERATEGRGERLHRIVARHVPTGQLAAQTVVVVEVDHPERGHQHDTSVTRGHRGHRLGLLLKAQMMRHLREEEPRLATIDTWNAESNDHMIGVNKMLGYQVMGREIAYQRSLTE